MKRVKRTRRDLGNHVISLFLAEYLRWLKSGMKKIYKKDIENNLIIKDHIVNLGYLLVCTVGNFLAPLLVNAHTVNNLDLGDEQCFENESYEID